MIIINAILAYALWKIADLYFDIGRTAIGWCCVVMSAVNMAAFMAEII